MSFRPWCRPAPSGRKPCEASHGEPAATDDDRPRLGAEAAALRQDAPRRRAQPLDDAVALAVLKLCDGQRTVDQISRELAKAYSAPDDRILKDVIAMLQELADKGVLSG